MDPGGQDHFRDTMTHCAGGKVKVALPSNHQGVWPLWPLWPPGRSTYDNTPPFVICIGLGHMHYILSLTDPGAGFQHLVRDRKKK